MRLEKNIQRRNTEFGGWTKVIGHWKIYVFLLLLWIIGKTWKLNGLLPELYEGEKYIQSKKVLFRINTRFCKRHPQFNVINKRCKTVFRFVWRNQGRCKSKTFRGKNGITKKASHFGMCTVGCMCYVQLDFVR